ncbi:MAG TPA: hypothetical protein VGH87_06460 [Polyangiaceae bacterium]|jgi:hypothetical protein
MRWAIALVVGLACATARADDVTVVVRGDAGADFQLRGVNGWTTLCRTPCKAVGPADGFYRIGGAGIVPSRAVRSPNGDAIVLDASKTTFASYRDHASETIAGIAVASAGGALVLAGFVWAWALANANDCLLFVLCARSYDTTGPNITLLVGALTMLVGGVLIGSGLEGRHASRLVPLRIEF